MLAAICVAGWHYSDEIVEWVEGLDSSPAKDEPTPDPEAYTVLSDDLESQRKLLSAQYAKATTNVTAATTSGRTGLLRRP